MYENYGIPYQPPPPTDDMLADEAIRNAQKGFDRSGNALLAIAYQLRILIDAIKDRERR